MNPDEVARTSVDVTRRSVETQRKSSDIPRLYAEARQSIDIVQRSKVTADIKKRPTKKVVSKAKKKAISIEEHKLTVPQVVSLYKSGFDPEFPDKIKGLEKDDAEERLKINGPNELAPPRKRPQWLKFIDQFLGLFSLLLIVAGILCFVTVAINFKANKENIYLGAILLVVVFINNLITWSEERKGEKLLEGFANLGGDNCTVYRSGELLTLDIKKIVAGDIVRIKGGDKPPADLRLLISNGVKVDNASLTGEQEAQKRVVDVTHHNPLETANLVFFGTLVLEGEGVGIVIRTGNNTVIGQIASLANTTVKLDTPLRREINKFVRVIGLIAVVMALLFFGLGFAVGQGFVANFVFAIGIIVANVPQGLIATVTLLLTISAKRLAKRNVIVKNLESVETLGSTTIIASDKTGTLTQNRMTVVDLWVDGRIQSIPYDRYMTAKKADAVLNPLTDESKITTTQMLERGCVLCNRTVFKQDEENQGIPILDKGTIGDASETALLKYFETRPDRVDSATIRDTFPKVFEIPFNSTNKWQLSIHKNTKLEGMEANPRVLLMKGAPERVIKQCSKIRIDGNDLPLDEDFLDQFQQAYEYLAGKGERVLGFAQKYLDPETFPPTFDKEYDTTNVPSKDLVFIGLTGLMDPPKIGVPEAIEKCKSAGIQVIMVTGDHPATAKAIAKQVGIIEGKTVEDIADEEDCRPEDVDPERADAVVLHGEKIETLTDKDWKLVLSKKQIVFSRTSPQQKLEIVERCQAIGHVVAVTGDGVNDSPALKKADLGISMNITGSDVSKEAAAIILLDDNFASIVNGIEEGRLIFDNLKKSIAYTLTHILPEIIPFLVNVAIGLPLPLTALSILCIDLGTELVAATALAYEKPESNIMHRPPRAKDDALVSTKLLSFAYLQVGVLETLGCFFGYFVIMQSYGLEPRALVGASRTYFTDDAPVFYTNGRAYTAREQMTILGRAQATYFICIVMIQWMNVFNSKARTNSLFSQGVFNNSTLFVGVLYAAAITCIIFYIPGLNSKVFHVLKHPTGFSWIVALPWMALIFIYDEVRKLLIRQANWRFLEY